MTIFLHGGDGYRRTQRLRILLDQFLRKYPGVGVRRLDTELDEDAAGKAGEVLGSASLFSPRVLLVLNDALDLPMADLAPLIERTSSSDKLHLILVASADKVAKAYSRLQEDDIKQEHFPTLTGSDWARFVAREARARNLSLGADAVRQLAYAFPGDGWGVATELDVLAAMPEDSRPERIRTASRSALSGTPGWGELRKLGTGRPASRLATLVRIERGGDPAAKTFAMAAYSANPRTAAAGDIAVKTGGWDHEEALLALALY